jgi:ABC-2 type transport system ATP-binding protein
MLIKIENLAKRYNEKSNYAVENINLHGNEGEIIGILGHNGAGKSTTIKCITGMHPYEKGRILINGYDLATQPIKAKQSFGYVSDEFTLFEKMTGFEFINFMADIYKVPAEVRAKRIAAFQDIFALGDSIYNEISSYSHGMKQKISLMGALIHNPRVFILDEPMVGLDPFTANKLKMFFKQHSANGNLVLFSSHNLDVVEKLCDRVYVIDQGHILVEIDMHKFRKSGMDLETYFLSITKRVAKVHDKGKAIDNIKNNISSVFKNK